LQGRELLVAWNQIDRGIAGFVLQLAEFDASGAWAEDGYASCASWISDKCQLSRSDAFDKMKVSRELTRRHVVRVAFAEGLPYSKVRLLVRLDGVDHERDEEFVAHARTDSIRVLEERVNNWNYDNGQDKPPANLDDHYGIRRSRGFGGGLGRVVIEAPDDMLDRLFALLDAYGHFLHFNDKPAQLGLSTVDSARVEPPVDNQSRIWTPGEPSIDDEPAAVRPRSAKRLDWLFDLLEEIALADPRKLDPYVASVGVTIQYEDLMAATGHGLTAQGSTITGEAARRLCCDAGIHRVVVKGQSEILDFGREERLFNRQLRRAIRFRHGHACAVRGCGRRITHIHHVEHFENGGETTVHNGIPLCSYHHHLVHEGGWQVAWNPTTGITRIEGPKGQVLETTASFLRAA
jgi:hypothetical protein